MKGFILLILGIIVALLVVGGAVAFHFMNEMGINVEDANSDAVKDVVDKVSNIPSSESSDSSSDDSGDIVDDNANDDNVDDDIVNEEIKFNYQNGEGYYREVTYKDGGFRQFDLDTGELIGSSYDSDQDKLPSME
jgi:hypothetical protein